MPRIRSIHPGQWCDEDFLECSLETRMVAIALRNHSDDNGIFPWRPRQLKLWLFPVDDIDIEKSLQEGIDHNQLQKFEVNGDAYGMIRNFQKFQSPRKPAFQYPVPDPPLGTDYELNKAYGGGTAPVPHQYRTAAAGEDRTGSDRNRNRNGEDEDGTGSGGAVSGDADSVAVGLSPSDFFSAWNNVAGQVGLPLANTMSAKRLEAFERQCSDPEWIKDCAAAMKRIPELPFLQGTGKEGWKATIDWLLKPESVRSILGGKYDNFKPQIEDLSAKPTGGYEHNDPFS